MEQDKLDDLFRNIIIADESDLNEEERASKEVVWDRLELPKKKSNFHFWKIAVTVLFLLLSGTMALVWNNNQTEGDRFTQLELELEQTKNVLSILEKKLAEGSYKSKESFPEKEQINIDNPIATTNHKLTKENIIIENVVLVYDTIWMEKSRKVNENIRLVRDTIFIEVPEKSPVQWVNEEIIPQEKEELIDKKKAIKKKKYPSKVEFVFGKKPLPKPSIKLDLFPNEIEMAKKAKQKNRLITIPINN